MTTTTTRRIRRCIPQKVGGFLPHAACVGKSHMDYCAGFGNTFWRNVLLISLGTAAALKLAPVAGDDVYLTRWMAMYATPGSYWMAMNAKHTIQQEQVARENMLLNDASLPAVRRFRYPQ